MAEQLTTSARESGGRHVNRRLRDSGMTPAVLYGHGETNITLSVPSDALSRAMRHGSRLVALTGAVNESAFIRDLQWDTYGTSVMHVDLSRVSADELVKVHLPLELRGEAPGLKEGGIVELLLHDITIECPAGSIPEKIFINVKNLKLNDTIMLGGIELPDRAKAVGDPELMVVHCIVPLVRGDDEGEGGAAEPEVIGGKKDEEGEAATEKK